MSIESVFFERMSPEYEKLLPFGFSSDGEGYSYSEEFMDGNFRADLHVDKEGKVAGKVIDLDTDEEYMPIHIESHTGTFVGAVREAYIEVLRRVADACFVKEPFLFGQTNRISRLIFEKYGDKPDYPFKNLPDYGAFRCPVNRKWYGLVMNIPRRLLDKTDKAVTHDDRGAEKIEILNLKVAQDALDGLLAMKGIYPCYHMNRANWVSVLLDDTLSDDFIMGMVAESRNLVARVKKSSGSSEQRQKWIIPANPRYFDLEAAFEEQNIIIWKQSSNIRVGDIVYMYVASPLSSVRYKCEVVEVDIPYEYKDENVSMSRVMKIRKLKEYEGKKFSLDWLKSVGIKTVRGPRLAPESFVGEIESH